MWHASLLAEAMDIKVLIAIVVGALIVLTLVLKGVQKYFKSTLGGDDSDPTTKQG